MGDNIKREVKRLWVGFHTHPRFRVVPCGLLQYSFRRGAEIHYRQAATSVEHCRARCQWHAEIRPRSVETQCTPSCIGWTFQKESSISSVCLCTDASTPSSSVSDRPLHTNIWHCFAPAPAFSQQSSSLRPTLPAQHVRPSGFFCCWSEGLKLTAWRHAGSEVFHVQLLTVTEDIFIFAVLVCSAHQRFAARIRYINSLLTLTLTSSLSPP